MTDNTYRNTAYVKFTQKNWGGAVVRARIFNEDGSTYWEGNQDIDIGKSIVIRLTDSNQIPLMSPVGKKFNVGFHRQAGAPSYDQNRGPLIFDPDGGVAELVFEGNLDNSAFGYQDIVYLLYPDAPPIVQGPGQTKQWQPDDPNIPTHNWQESPPEDSGLPPLSDADKQKMLQNAFGHNS